MKRWSGILLAAATALLTVGCGGTKAPAISTEQIEIAAYKGLEIARCEAEVITEAVVDQTIESMVGMEGRKETAADRTAEVGDWAVLEIKCAIDGTLYENLCYEGTEVIIPAPGEINMDSPDLLGRIAAEVLERRAGDSFTLDFAIPNDYPVFPDIAGKTAQWEVTVKELFRYEPVEFNQGYVQGLGISGVNTVEEYRAYLRRQLEIQAQHDAAYTLREEALAALMGQVTVTGDLTADVEAYKQQYLETYHENARLLNVSFEEYAKNYLGCSAEELEKEMQSMAEIYLKEDLALDAVASAEDLHVTEEYYQAEADNYAIGYNYESGQQLEESFGKESVLASMERDRILDYIVSQAEQVEKVSDAGQDSPLEEAKKLSDQMGKLLYVTIILAAAFLVVLVILIVNLLKNKRDTDEE